MTITFFSSVLNHHQMPFCQALCQCPGVTFTFVQMIQLTEERRKMGFAATQADFVVSAIQEPEKAYRLCMDSDVVIAGVIHQSWINERVAQGKLTFAYKERFCKAPLTVLRPGFWRTGYRDYFRFRNKNLYLLCASAYTAADTRIIFPRPEKKFKWGYFPQINIHEDKQTLLDAKTPHSILWVGRFIKLKHPERCIQLAKELKKEGIPFQLDIVGLGELENTLKSRIREESLEDCVKLLGQLSPEQVRKQMGQHQIFLFTSDRNEGWGAVVNEAMSEGCACISSRQAGCTNFLISDGVNGFSYKWDDIDTLVNRVKQLLQNRQLLRSVQESALDTIHNQWNAQTAAQRFVVFCTAVLNQSELPVFSSGPMSHSG